MQQYGNPPQFPGKFLIHSIRQDRLHFYGFANISINIIAKVKPEETEEKDEGDEKAEEKKADDKKPAAKGRSKKAKVVAVSSLIFINFITTVR
jgi:hypothetical protein